MRHYRAAAGAAAGMALVLVSPATASAQGHDWHGGDDTITIIAGDSTGRAS
jgi:hypothetical protein